MHKEEILKSIAELGYNVGFGAKKHFATYDIVEKVPGGIGLISMAFGIYALVFESLSTKTLSASFLTLGLIGLYISFYQPMNESYRETGEKLTRLFYDLRDLYGIVKSEENISLSEHLKRLQEIRENYFECCLSKQILFSDWYAHYKFFWQQQIEWIDEQKHFSLFRDKIPLTFTVFFVTVFFAIIIIALKIKIISLLQCYICNS